jgi:hypothetical protein
LICTTRLFDFLNSGQHFHLQVRLEDAFQIRFVTIGEQHVKDRKNVGCYEPTRYVDEDVVQGGEPRTKRNNYWLTLTPRGTARNPAAFENQCLLVAVVLGNLLNSSREQGAKAAADAKLLKFFLQYPCKPMTAQLAGLVTWSVTELYHKLCIGDPIKLGICEKLAQYYDSQIVIFSDHSPPKVVATYPTKPNHKLKPIYLHLTKTEEDRYHVNLIKNVVMFFNQKGFACIGCSFSTKRFDNLRHSCRNKLSESCFACHRTLRRVGSYVNSSILPLYCDSRLKNNYAMQKCKECGVKLFSESCRLAHTPSFCRRKGFTCNSCHKFVSQIRNPENQKAHTCSKYKRCKYCKEEMPTGLLHLCQYDSPATSKHLENLSICHMTYSTTNAQCIHCFDSVNKNCPRHPFGGDREIVPVLCHLLTEEDTHGEFTLTRIYDPMFKKETVTQDKALSFNYLLPELPRDLFKGKRTYGFKQPVGIDQDIELTLQKLREKKDKTVTESLLATICCSKFQNYCFVTTEGKAINSVIKAMVLNGLTPRRPLVKGAQAISLLIPYFGIKFVCLSQFLKGSCSDLIKQFNLDTEEIYFPQLLPLNEAALADSLPQAPAFDYYEEIMDSEEERAKKLSYWNQIKDLPFDYLVALEALAKRQLDILSLSALHYAKTCLMWQNKCYQFYGRPGHFKIDSLPVVHAFRYVSMPSFMKATFRTFALKKDTLFTVRDQYGKKTPSSRLETEATEFLRLKEEGQWITAYSGSEGQQKFFLPGQKHPFLIADAYNPLTKTVVFING